MKNSPWQDANGVSELANSDVQALSILESAAHDVTAETYGLQSNQDAWYVQRKAHWALIGAMNHIKSNPAGY